MNKILEKFIKKVEKIKKFIILHQDDSHALLAAPITIDRTYHVHAEMSFTPKLLTKDRKVYSLALFTVDKASKLSKFYKSHGILVCPLTAAGQKNTIEEIELSVPKAIFEHARLHTHFEEGDMGDSVDHWGIIK